VAGRSNLMEVDVHDTFGELSDQWMSAVEVLAFPAPAEARQHIKGEPDVFEGDLFWETLAARHVTVEDDHRGDVEWDWGSEESNVWEFDKLVVHDYNVVGGDNGCGKEGLV